MNIFKTDAEASNWLAAVGLHIFHDYDRGTDCEYWYIASERDGRVEFKTMSRGECFVWADIQAERALFWADEVRALQAAS